MGTRPVKILKDGPVNVVIWRNESTRGGDTYYSCKVFLAKFKKDDNGTTTDRFGERGNWEDSAYFNEFGVVKLYKLLEHAISFIDEDKLMTNNTKHGVLVGKEKEKSIHNEGGFDKYPDAKTSYEDDDIPF